jgi:two-component system, NtrC family, sensor kinase
VSEREGTSATRGQPPEDPLPTLPRTDGGRAAAIGEPTDLTAAQLIQAQKMDAVGQLVAGVAHELNNPLASIVAFSQLIRTDPNLPKDLHRQADLLVQEANRIRVIVGNLLDFARARPPERLDLELRPIVEGVLSLQSYLFARSRVIVDVDIPADLPRVSVDRAQLQHVLVNLTVNAAQAIEAVGRPGRITIRADVVGAEDARRVRIAVSDDGPGVAPEVQDRLFMPFVTTKPRAERTGLGLSVAAAIIAAHGGTIRHEARPGGGTTFVIELPVRDPPPLTASSHALPPAPPAVERRAARILVLDDEPSIRDFLSRVLTRAGYTPLIARTGAAALEIVRTDPPDAILCDHRMGGMNGTEFHDAVAAIQPRLARRFAFMSGDVLNPQLRDFAAARGVQLLAKPFDIATVARTVETLLGPGG